MKGEVVKGIRRAALVAITIFGWHSAWADAWVESFSGDATGYSISRAGEPLSVAILATLLPGDTAQVMAPDGEMVIVYQTGESVRLTAADGAHVVSGSAEAPSALQNLIRWSMDTVKGLVELINNIMDA